MKKIVFLMMMAIAMPSMMNAQNLKSLKSAAVSAAKTAAKEKGVKVAKTQAEKGTDKVAEKVAKKVQKKTGKDIRNSSAMTQGKSSVKSAAGKGIDAAAKLIK